MTKCIDGFQLTKLKNTITINGIVTVHYFEYSKNYIFEGEKHDFWEVLYVDKGKINIMADNKAYILEKGEMIFHKPNEWHNVIGNGKVAPNLVVIAFECRSKAMQLFNHKILRIDDKVKNYLAMIVSEAQNVFSSDLSDPTLKALKKKNTIKQGAEQLIQIYLELLLIEMLRNIETYSTATKPSSTIHEYAQEEKLKIIIDFLEESKYERLTLEDICRRTLLSKSSLVKIFKEGMGISVMEYFKKIKIEEAKTLIREGNHNFTQIASILGYNSIHYFSRTFKRETSMTLSEYASSVKLYLQI